MDTVDPKNEYLVISRGQWDSDASQEDIQHAIDEFYAWYERGLELGRLKPGSRLTTEGRVVTKSSVTDGPFAESRELIGGYWLILADSLDAAAAIAMENPCVAFGLTIELRPLDSSRALATAITNETPSQWIKA